jgi:DNA-binding NtrC family response regulator
MASKHVLVVDDDPLILEVLARALSGRGLRVSTARRVTVAKSILAHESIDAVLTDARMPGESGLALAATTRELGIATIIMSGDLEWAAEHGLAGEEFLAKPFDLPALLDLVDTYLTGNAASQDGVAGTAT